MEKGEYVIDQANQRVPRLRPWRPGTTLSPDDNNNKKNKKKRRKRGRRIYSPQTLGYWHQSADDERYGNPPQGNPELLVVRDKVGRPPGEHGVSKSME